jgi:uncharacterized phage infection (PIP) family protein YhgE
MGISTITQPTTATNPKLSQLPFTLQNPPQVQDTGLQSWMNDVARKLNQVSAIAWPVVDKSGSSIGELANHSHDSLAGVFPADLSSTNTKEDKHISDFQGKRWEDHRLSHNPPGFLVADAVVSTVSATGTAGGTYTATEQGMLNNQKAAINQLVTDLNNAITQVNALLASLRTITIIHT